MIATIIVGCVLFVLLVSVWQLMRASRAGTNALQAWEAHKCEVNVDVFRLLVDPKEEAYLWKSVSLLEFHGLQRKRILLALRSVRMMARNAALLTKVAAQARQAGDAEVASAADRLMFLAVQVRMNALVAEFYLLLKWVFPTAAIGVPMRFERYQRLLESLDWILARGQQRPTHTLIRG